MSSAPDNGLKAHIAIFASGRGSNALRIIEHFQDHAHIHVALIVTNKPTAGVLAHATAKHIPSLVITRRQLQDRARILPFLQACHIDFIVLAGFMILVPAWLVQAFSHRIVNIHPALLPKFGGKGMYGMHVHEAVKEAGETISGITIHYVNEAYDEGDVIAQYPTPLRPEDTPEDIAAKVRKLEHKHYPVVIEQVVREEVLAKHSRTDN
jgi:phosphoribosylglycinamide formyltransferase-1